jgi:hypothetical protein
VEDSSKTTKSGEPTPFDELRRLAWRFVPQPKRDPGDEPSRPSVLRSADTSAWTGEYSEDELRNQKIARILHELGSADDQLLDALVAACDTHHEKQLKDIEVRAALVDLLDGWDSCDNELDLTQRAMNLAADGLTVLSGDPAWSPDAVLAPTQVEKMRKCLQHSSNLEPAGRTNEEPQAMGVTLAKQLVRAMLADEVRAAAPKLVDRMFDYRRKQREKLHTE